MQSRCWVWLVASLLGLAGCGVGWDDAEVGTTGRPTSVVWTGMAGVSASGNDLTKTATARSWLAGAVSVGTILGDGYVEFTTGENTAAKMAGLSHGDEGPHYTDIDFAIHLKANGHFAVYEAGVLRGLNFGTYAAGDRFRVENAGGVVTYARNGIVFYTSSVAPTLPLLVDTSLFTPGATIHDADLVSTAVNWQNAVGVSATGNDLTKTAPETSWRAGASSYETIAGDGYVEFTTGENTTAKMVGLSLGDNDQRYTDIDFAIHLKANGRFGVYEAGVLRGNNFGSYAAGDRFRVENAGGVVTYERNGAVFYTSSVAPTLPLLVDTSLFTPGATIQDAVLVDTGSACSIEACDGLDNDCDGFVDEDFALGAACDDGGIGACRDGGLTVCDPADDSQTTCDLGEAPDPVPGAPLPEGCNGRDDDCDAVIDEACTGGGPPSFAPGAFYAAPLNGDGIAIDDLDLDGTPDVVVSTSQGASVLLGNGDGTLQPQITYPAGDATKQALAVADLNGDSAPDIVVTGQGNSTPVAVLIGNGDGTFRPPVTYPASGSVSLGVAIGDLVVTNDLASTLSVLRGNGDGTFASPVHYPTNTNPLAVAIGDLDRDGILDVVTDTIGGTLSVLLGNGDGTLRPRVDFFVGNPGGVAIGDVDQDGRADLVATNCCGASTVSILLGRGDGSFQAAQTYQAGVGPGGVAIGDLNGDWLPDLVITDNNNDEAGINVSILSGNGDGGFDSPVQTMAGRSPAGVAIGDLNGDGQPDIAVAANQSETETVGVFLNTQ